MKYHLERLEEFDDWFKDRFPEYVLGTMPLEPYYGIAQIAYEQGIEDAKSVEVKEQ